MQQQRYESLKAAIEEARQDCPDPKVLIEQRLDFSCYVPDGFGTGDCLIVADKLLHIIDLKYGQGVLVNAEENPQMMLYGDTLWAIAKKYLGNGSRYKEIVSLNGLKSNVIYSGMKLKIPNK